MVFKREDTLLIKKHGVSMRVYNSSEDCPQAAVVWQETETGHAEEFFHERSAFIFYIIEGGGVWIIEDVEHPVQAGDVVIIPPGKRFTIGADSVRSVSPHPPGMRNTNIMSGSWNCKRNPVHRTLAPF